MNAEVVAIEEGVLVVEDVLNAYIVKDWVALKKIITLYMVSFTRQPIFSILKFLSQFL